MQRIYLDFTGIYEGMAENGASYEDLRGLHGTDMYLSPEAAEQIRRRIAPYGPCGIHFLDSGNYHYMTALFAEMAEEDFILVLFDHHTDMQKPLAEDLLSCGCWAAYLADHCERVRQILVAGPPAASMEEIDIRCSEKLLTLTEEEIMTDAWRERISLLRRDLPVYVSIDRDVLDSAYAHTNWDQGALTPSQIAEILREITGGRRILAADLCGELSDSLAPVYRKREARALHEKTDAVLLKDILLYTG